MRQLNRPANELVVWALAISALTMGFLIAAVMRWSGARSLVAGLRHGAILGSLFWASVNFGLFASSHIFSGVSVVVDWVSSGSIMTLSSAVAAWVLGGGKAQGCQSPSEVSSGKPMGSLD